MKTVCLVLMILLLLTGCGAAPVWETVEDFVPEVPVSAWQEDARTVQIRVPEGTVLAEAADGYQLYEAGELLIETSTFLASDLDTAVRRLSGYERDRLMILQTTKFDLPEYQFAWYSQTEEGGRLCRADLVMDGMTCYAVVCSTPEAAGDSYDTQSRQVFASFDLSEETV